MRSDIRHALCSHHERTLDVLLSRICFNLNMSLQIWLRVAARFAKWVFATNRIKDRSQSWIHLVRLLMTSQHCSTENAYQTTELNWLYCMCRLSEKHTSSRKCTCEQMCILIVFCQRYVWDLYEYKTSTERYCHQIWRMCFFKTHGYIFSSQTKKHNKQGSAFESRCLAVSRPRQQTRSPGPTNAHHLVPSSFMVHSLNLFVDICCESRKDFAQVRLSGESG